MAGGSPDGNPPTDYRALLDLIHEMVTVSDRDGAILYANAATERISGYPPEEFAKLDPFEQIHPEDRPRCDKALRELAKTPGLKLEIEHRIRHASGEWRWVSGTFESRFDDPAIGGIVATVRDITERRRVEEILRDSEGRQAFLLRLSDAFRAHTDPEAIGTFATRMVAEYMQVDRCYIAQFSREEERGWIGSEYRSSGLPPLTGEYRFADFPEGMKRIETGPLIIRDLLNDASLSETDRHSMEKGLGVQAMLAAVLRKGERNYVWCLTAATTGPRNWTDGDIKFLEDVAERTWAAVERARAEEKIRKSEERLQLAGDATGVASFIWYPEEDFIEFGDRLTRLFGLPDGADLTLEKALDYFHPDSVEPYREAVAALLDPNSSNELHQEVRIVRPDGEERWLENIARAYFDGTKVRAAGTVVDITGRRRQEEALRESEEKLRAFVVATSDTVYEMSADWREMRPIEGKGFVASTESPRDGWTEEYIPEEERPRVREAIDRAIKTRSDFELEHRVARFDGTTGWTFSRAIPILDERGEILKWFGAASDVTERKWREASQKLLIGISEDLSRLSGEEEIVRSAGAKLAAHLGLTCYHYVDVDEARAEVTVRHFWHAHDVPSTLGTFPVEGFVPPDGLRRRRAGRTDVAHDVQRDLPDNAATAALKAGAAAQKIGAYVVVPYSQNGRWKAYFAVADSAPRRWTDLEVELIEEVAGRVFPRVERVRVEKALRDSEARFRGLVEPFSQAVWETDAEGRVVADSPSWRAYTGQSLKSWLGEGWAEAVHPDDRAYALGQWREAVRAGTVVDAEFRLRNPDGGWRWTNVRAAPLFRDDGTVARWTGLNIDISERKQAEAAFRDSEKRYRRLFTSMDQGFCVIEKLETPPGEPSDFRYVVANPAFERHTGLSDPIGKTILHLVPEAETAIMNRYDRVVQTGRSERFEDYIAPLDLWLDVEVFSIETPGQLAVLFSNITERKQAEIALRESDKRQAFLLRLSDALRPLADPFAIQETAMRVLGEYLEVDRTLYAEVEPDNEHFVIAGNHVRGSFHEMIGRYSLSDFGQTPNSQRVGATLVLPDINDARESDRHLAAYLAAGMQAIIGVPLHKDGRWVASLIVHHGSPRRWTPEEAALVSETAERTWAAVERAKSERALRESEERFRTLVDQSPLAVHVFTPDGTSLRSNPAWVRLWNLGPEEDPTGENIFDDERLRNAGLTSHLRNAVSGERLTTEPVFYAPPDSGETGLWLRAFVYPIHNAQGDVAEVVLMLQDVTEGKLRRDEQERSELREAAVRAEAAERERISRELHDRVAHSMGVAHQSLELYRVLTESDPERAAVRLDIAREHVLRSLERTRNLAIELRRSVADEISEGLETAIENLIHTTVPDAVETELSFSGGEGRLTQEVGAQVYLIVREALQNILKHSNCEKLVIEVEIGASNLRGTVTDEGDGFDPEQLQEDSGLGLGSMQERAQMLGGTLSVKSHPGDGTSVIVEVPLKRGEGPGDG